MKISALILAKNEEEVIQEALSQLSFANEIILLDQNSSDNTPQLAKKYTDKIFFTNSDHFANNRNLLAEKAKGEWLLYVDADERISEQLKKEILEVTSENKFVAYYFPRKNFILGKWVKHGGYWPDYVPRLFKKDQLIGWKGRVHESPRIKGESGYMKLPIEHKTARNLRLMLEKSIKWAKIEARLYARAQNPKVTTFRVIKFSLSRFIHMYFYKKAFLDGKVGFIASLYQALHNAMILTYLWEIQNESQNKFQKASEII